MGTKYLGPSPLGAERKGTSAGVFESQWMPPQLMNDCLVGGITKDIVENECVLSFFALNKMISLFCLTLL